MAISASNIIPRSDDYGITNYNSSALTFLTNRRLYMFPHINMPGRMSYSYSCDFMTFAGLAPIPQTSENNAGSNSKNSRDEYNLTIMICSHIKALNKFM